jgi:hypothetical protein
MRRTCVRPASTPVYRVRMTSRGGPAMDKISRVAAEYAALVGFPIIGVLVSLQIGAWLPAPAAAAGELRAAAASGGANLPSLIFSVAVLVACARVSGIAARRVGQPQVVGEMAMGITVGPSLLARPRPGHHLASPLLHAGGDGAGDDVHDDAVADAALSGSGAARAARPCADTGLRRLRAQRRDP